MNKKYNWTLDQASFEWLNSQKKSTKLTYQKMWNFFLQYTELTGNQILESKRVDKDYSWEKKVLAFKKWLVESKGQSENSAKTGAAAVRGFFAFHRLPLVFRRGESATLKEAKRKTEDYRFSRDDLKKMSEVADLEERYVLTAGKSFGLRAGDFMKLSRGDLEPYLDRPVPISIGEYSTQKEKVKAYPFIDSDALPVIRLILEKMTREGRTKPEDRILTYKHEVQLSRVIRRLDQKAGINVGNKAVRFHCLRKFLIDHLASFMSESKWKQIVGKAISEGAYVSPDSLREDYARAMVETAFTRAALEDTQKVAKKEALLQMAKMFGMTEADIKTMFTQRAAKSLDDEIIVLEGIVEQKRRTQHNGGSSDCLDGVHCGETFEQIPETQLLAYLKQGWQIVHRLASGDLIVKRA